MLKQNDFSRIYNIAVQILDSYPPQAINQNVIIDAVEKAIGALPHIKDFSYKDQLILKLYTNFTVKSTKSSIIRENSNHKEWYFSENKIKRMHWESYREYLKTNKQYSIDGVNSIDTTTDSIMSFLKFIKKL